MRRVAVVLTLFFAVAAPLSAADTHRSRPSTTRRGASSRRRSRRPSCRRSSRRAAAVDLPRLPEGARLAVALSAEGPHDVDAEFKPDTRSWQVNVWWDKAGEIATGQVDDATARRDRGVDGAAGRVGDGARQSRRVRRQEAEQLFRLARLLRHLPARARRLAPAALAAHARPRRAALVLGRRCGSSTAATSSPARRSPTRRSCT